MTASEWRELIREDAPHTTHLILDDLAALEQCIESWKREELLWDEQEKKLVERVKVLEEALDNYGEHRRGCHKVYRHDTGNCACGLDAVLGVKP